MTLDEAIAAIDSCHDLDSLNSRLQSIVEGYGFNSYSFIDVGAPHLDLPYYTTTTDLSYANAYIDNNFIHVDAAVHKARRTNRPFDWGEVDLPARNGKRKPGALKVMEAASDFGFKNGLVVPFHFVDGRGSVYSSLGALFWKEKPKDFETVRKRATNELHLIFVYWVQRSIELRREPEGNDKVVLFNRRTTVGPGLSLTDREKDVIAWAARGKTSGETAAILNISAETVQTHIKNCVDKLGAGNKTHAVAKAIHLGLVDL